MAHIGCQTGVSEQNMQHFMSQSPWSGREAIHAMQEAVTQRTDWQGGVLILDESGDAKYGDAGAGVARQYNGRHKQVERSQVLAAIDSEVQRLPARQREAFVLRYWEELDVAETAAAMGCSEGSVKTHCSRATHALAQALKAKGIRL